MQTDMFSKPAMKPTRITLDIRGKIPSHKNNKMLIKPSGRELLKYLAAGNLAMLRHLIPAYLKRPVMMITKPEYQRTMETMIASIESQLLCASQTALGQTLQTKLTPLWIASSLPADDCWTKLPEVVIRGELCEPGKEGATIVVERIK